MAIIEVHVKDHTDMISEGRIYVSAPSVAKPVKWAFCQNRNSGFTFPFRVPNYIVLFDL